MSFANEIHFKGKMILLKYISPLIWISKMANDRNFSVRVFRYTLLSLSTVVLIYYISNMIGKYIQRNLVSRKH